MGRPRKNPVPELSSADIKWIAEKLTDSFKVLNEDSTGDYTGTSYAFRSGYVSYELKHVLQVMGVKV